MALDIYAVNLGLRQALMNDGTMAPITHFFDENGYGVDGPYDAVTFIVGPASDGKWRVEELNNWAAASVQ